MAPRRPQGTQPFACTPPAHTKTPRPTRTTVTVLNGNGATPIASSLLAQRGHRTALPAGSLAANAPSESYFESRVYYDVRRAGARAAAAKLAVLLAPAEVLPLPHVRGLLALDPGSMLVAVVGQTFHNELVSPQPRPTTDGYVPPETRFDPSAGLALLRPLATKVPFELETPTVLERSSQPDTFPGDVDARLYWIDGVRRHRAVRLVFVTGAGTFWGIEETDMPSPPILAAPSFTRHLGNRAFEFYYSGADLHMVVLRRGAVTYWVVNTLLNSLSNETMIAIAQGLKPIRSAR
jgi:hypothetical protein